MSAFSMSPCSARLSLLSWHLTRCFLASSVNFDVHPDIYGHPYISNMSEFYQTMLHRQRGDARTRAWMRERKMYKQCLQYAPASVRHNRVAARALKGPGVCRELFRVRTGASALNFATQSAGSW